MKISINDTKYVDNASDVKHKDIVTIASEGKWEESSFKKEDGSPQNVFKVNLKLQNGELRNATLNWTNVKILVTVFGEETETWVGKEVRAWKTKSDKAKLGFTFLYVPTDWNRDDTGEWIKPEAETQESPKAGVETIEYPVNENDLDGNEIPF
jgi:hypothetical protein